MNFNEWLVWNEALEAVGAKQPAEILALADKPLDDMTDQEIELLARWHGIWGTPTRNANLHDLSPVDQARARIRHRRESRLSAGLSKDPAPEEVRDREVNDLWKSGKLHRRWLARAS